MSNPFLPPDTDGATPSADALAHHAPGVLPGVQTLLSESWEDLKAHPGPSILGFAGGMGLQTMGVMVWYVLFFLAVMVMAGLSVAIGAAAGLGEDATGTLASLLTLAAMVVLYPLLFLAIAPAMVLMLRGGLFTARRTPPTAGSFFEDIVGLCGRTALLYLLMVVAIVPATFLLYVPGIYLAIRWSFALHFLIDAPLGVVDALRASWRATEGKVLDLFLKGMALSLLAMVVIVFTCYLGMFVALPMQMVVHARMYMHLTGRYTADGAEASMA